MTGAAAEAEAARIEKEKQTVATQPSLEAQKIPTKTGLPCWLSLGMATGTLGVGATTGYLAQSQKEAFNSSFNEAIRVKAARDGEQYALLSDMSWGAAGVLTAVAGLLFYRHANQPALKDAAKADAVKESE